MSELPEVVVRASENTPRRSIGVGLLDRWDSSCPVPNYVTRAILIADPNGPYTAQLTTLVPKTVPGIVFEARVLKWAPYAPFGQTVISLALVAACG